MAPTLLKFGLLLLAQLHLTSALVARASVTSSLASNQPQQTGTAINCAQFETAVSGQTCDSFKDFGLDRDQFKALNTQIDPECKNLIAGERYCVKLAVSSSSSIDTSAKTTLSTVTTLTTATKTTATSLETKMAGTSTTSNSVPTSSMNPQPGIAENCKQHARVRPDDDCDTIAERKHTTSDIIKQLNPVGPQCKNLWKGYDICVRV
ncbi:carbohydrate-binding module family 50 protein [Trichoderma camerunense]